jgi:hypothetical protein
MAESAATLPTPLQSPYPLINSILQNDSQAELVSTATTQPANLLNEIKALTIKFLEIEKTNVNMNRRLDTELLTNQELQDNLKAELAASIKANEILISGLRGIAASPSSKKHPDPSPFTGDDPSKLTLFLQDMSIKLRANQDWWSTEQERMGYFFSLLEGKAKAQFSSHINDDGTIDHTGIDAMIAVLRNAFGDIDEKRSAQRSIMRLKQGHKSLALFIPEFSEVAGKTGFDHTALIAHLREALHPDIIERLSFQTEIATTLSGFIDQARQADNLLRNLKPDYFKSNKNPNVALHYTPTAVTTSEGGDAMDLNAGRVTTAWTAEDVAARRRPRTGEEKTAQKAYNIAHNLCQWCDSADHFANVCPTAPWNKNKEKERREGKAWSLA